ncbi:MAG: DnaD domain protein [Clostridia bacterium]|nr:DnaD domain protein [Clostridia bacterium]
MFETDGQALYFGVTAIENIFLTEYMPAAKGDYVKVYLSALYHSRIPGDACGVPELAHELGLDQAQAEAALRYWERRGLISLIGGGEPRYRLYSAVQRALTGQDAAPRVDERFVAFSESVYALFGDSRKVRPSEIAMAYEWVQDLGLTEDAVLTLLSHMRVLSGTQFSFARAQELAARMRMDGVLDAEDADSYLSVEEAVRTGAKAVLRRLGLRRQPTEDELNLYRKWTKDWGYEQDAVLAACQRTTAGTNPSFKYLDGILAGLRADDEPMTEDRVTDTIRLLDEETAQIAEVIGALGIRATAQAVKPIYRQLKETMPHDVIVIAARECRSVGKNDLVNLQRLLGAWQEKGLTDGEKVSAYLDHIHELDGFLYRLYEACGHTGRATAADRAALEKWRAAGAQDDMLLLAAEQGAGAEGVKMRYVKKVAESWLKAGVTTREGAEALLRERPAAPKSGGTERQVSAQRYAQRDYQEGELERLVGGYDLYQEDATK